MRKVLPIRYTAPDKPGFVYAMRFSSGAVKVGRATDLKRRKEQHAFNAEVHGHRLDEVWSRWVEEQKFGEQRAIDAMTCDLTSARHLNMSGEWWCLVDYDEVVEVLERRLGKGTRTTEWTAETIEMHRADPMARLRLITARDAAKARERRQREESGGAAA